MEEKSSVVKGMGNYIKRIERCQKIYEEVLEKIPKDYKEKIYKIMNIYQK